MRLIGVNRSPYTRRVAIVLKHYGVSYQQSDLSGFGNRADLRAANPLGRIPALVLDSGETLIDSTAIVDFLDAKRGFCQQFAATFAAMARVAADTLEAA
mgnify:CR=1 FL=1